MKLGERSDVTVAGPPSRAVVWALAVILIASVGLGAPAASAVSATSSAKVFRVNWNERRQVGAGEMAFRVTRILVDGLRWRVAAQITNRSPVAVGINRRAPDSFRNCRTGLISYGRSGGPLDSWTTQTSTAASAAPRFPAVLRPGATWKRTFAGRGLLPKGKIIYVCFGFFTTAPDELGFSYITNGGFRI